MKIKIIIVFTLIFCACGKLPESPYFDNPQPTGQRDEIQIPKKLLGTYESLLDSGLMIITEGDIILKNVWNLNVPLTEVDSIDRLTLRDTVYQDSRSTMTVKVRNDSVYQRTTTSDTLYFHSGKYTIKKYKGYYFLNKKERNDQWLITTLRITDKGLLLGRAMTKEFINLLPDHTSSEPDSLTYLKPSDVELRKFLKNKDFSKESKFVRIEYGLQQKL
jgi:hypothetical protein